MFLVKHSQVNEYMVGPGRIAVAAKKTEGMALFQTFPKVRSVSFDPLNSPMRPVSVSAVIWGLCLPQN